MLNLAILGRRAHPLGFGLGAHGGHTLPGRRHPPDRRPSLPLSQLADERTREIPVLALSGYGFGSEAVRNAAEAGCDDFVLRPGPPDDVEQRLRRLLGGKGKPP